MPVFPTMQTLGLEREVHQLRRLVEISVTLNSTLDPDRLLQYIIESAADVLGCEAASILLYNEEDRALRFAASTGSDPESLARVTVPLDHSVAGIILREQRPLMIEDVDQDVRHNASVGARVGFQTRSLLGVPIPIQNRVIGVLEALNKRIGSFDEQDVAMLETVAALAGVAIENARLIRALQQAYQELGELDQLKSNFMALASHELRTPLMIILGYAAVLEQHSDGALEKPIKGVLRSARRMKSVVEAISKMKLLRAGAQAPVQETVALQAVVNAACDAVAPEIKEKRQTFERTLIEAPVLLPGNTVQLEQAFTNLLRNAVRFTPEEGSIAVEMAEAEGGIHVSIRDDGIGIPQDQLDRIFREFYQVEDHLTRAYGGLGLGLTIVRGIIHLHGGKIRAESEGLGKGAVFHVWLPVP